MPLLSRSTWLRIQQKLNQENAANPPALGHNVVSTWNPVLVRALDDTAVGGSTEGDQCFDAEVLLINSLESDQATGAAVWLTPLVEKDTASVPTIDAIYLGLYSGRFDPGSDSRPRVFAVPVGSSSGLVYDWVELTSDYTVTATAADTGLEISLPSAGTYEIFGSVSTKAEVSTGPGFANISYKLYNATTAADVSPVFAGARPHVVNVNDAVTTPMSWVITVAAASTIRLRAFHDPIQTYTIATVGSTGSGNATGMGYRKLA